MSDVCVSQSRDERWMMIALAEAERAAAVEEVPVGAVVICGDQIAGTGYNRREAWQSPLAHAELLAIDHAARTLGTWRLNDCEIYVTLEPCVMCVGAILQARIGRLVFGCLDPKAGAVQSLYQLCDDRRLNHNLPVRGGVLADRCTTVLSDFFERLRDKKRYLRDAERWPSPAEGA